MSMLADRRARKLYHLMPKGNKPLYEDDNRFGTKMLEKMGWTKGKGLGANEDGQKEFVRIKYKNDNIGIGFQDRDDQWTQHEESFNGLLKSLNNSKENSDAEGEKDDNDVPASFGFGYQHPKKVEEMKDGKPALSGESLEEKSKKSRARVHYKKFTRGKDISQYSEKDLANIFGKKTLDEKKVEETGTVETKNQEVEGRDSFSFGVETVRTRESLESYFKQKMMLLKSKEKRQPDRDEDVEETPPESKKFKQDNTSTVGEGMEEAVESDTVVSKRQKKKKSKSVAETDEMVLPEEQTSATSETEPRRKKKKKLRKHDGEENDGQENQSEEQQGIHQDLSQESLKLEKDPEMNDETVVESLNSVTNETKEERKKNKKKKKQKSYEEGDNDSSENLSNEQLGIGQETSQGSSEVDLEKTPEIEGKAATSIRPEDQESATNEIEGRRKKKKNKSKRKHEQEEESCRSENHLVLEETVEEEPDTLENTSDRKSYEEQPGGVEKVSGDEIQNENVIRISGFAAEKFRLIDFDVFYGSNIQDIPGYSLNENVQLEIRNTENCAARIADMWNRVEKNNNKRYMKNKLYIKKLKRRSAFSKVL